MSNTLTHLDHLIACQSITPSDANCQDYIANILGKLGYTCHHYQQNDVSNLYAELGTAGPRLVFAGHTDVVETGPLNDWQSPPFKLTEINNRLFGRGVADMKGAVAAMLTVAEYWAKNIKHHSGVVGFLFTSGEEGDNYLDGTPHVMQKLKENNIKIDFCIVGEPTAVKQTGDMIKVGRRGSLTGKARIKGLQGHVAYPHLANNAIHLALPFLNELSQHILDKGNQYFAPSSLQITKLSTPTSANNIIPGELDLQFNIRFNNLHTSTKLQNEIEHLALKHHLNLNWEWVCSGEPFLTQQGKLLAISAQCIKNICGFTPELSTTGGTSDARFIAPYNIEVVEIGLPNHTIHQANEYTNLEDLVCLEKIYLEILNKILN